MSTFPPERQFNFSSSLIAMSLAAAVLIIHTVYSKVTDQLFFFDSSVRFLGNLEVKLVFIYC